MPDELGAGGGAPEFEPTSGDQFEAADAAPEADATGGDAPLDAESHESGDFGVDSNPDDPDAAPADPRLVYEPHPLLAKALGRHYAENYAPASSVPDVARVVESLRSDIERMDDYDPNTPVSEDSLRIVAEDYVERHSIGTETLDKPNLIEGSVDKGIGRARDIWRGIKTTGASWLWSKAAARDERLQGGAGLVAGGLLGVGGSMLAVHLVPGIRNITYSVMGFFMGQKAMSDTLNNRDLRSPNSHPASFGLGFGKHLLSLRAGFSKEGIYGRGAKDLKPAEIIKQYGFGRTLLLGALSPLTNIARAWQVNLAERRLSTDDIAIMPTGTARDLSKIETLAAYLQYRIDRRELSGDRLGNTDPDLELFAAVMEKIANIQAEPEVGGPIMGRNHATNYRRQISRHGKNVVASVVVGGGLGALAGFGLTHWLHAAHSPAQAEREVGSDNNTEAPADAPAAPVAAAPAVVATAPEVTPEAPAAPEFTAEHNNLTATLTEHQQHLLGTDAAHTHDGHIIRREVAYSAHDAKGNNLLTSYNEQTNEWHFNQSVMDKWNITISNGQLDLSDVTEEGAKALHQASQDLLFDCVTEIDAGTFQATAGSAAEAAINHLESLRLESINHGMLETLRNQIGINAETLKRAGFDNINSPLGKFLQEQAQVAQQFLQGKAVDGITPETSGNVVSDARSAMNKWLNARMDKAMQTVGANKVSNAEQALRVSLGLEHLPKPEVDPDMPSKDVTPKTERPVAPRQEPADKGGVDRTGQNEVAQPNNGPLIEVEQPARAAAESDRLIGSETVGHPTDQIEVEQPATQIEVQEPVRAAAESDRLVGADLVDNQPVHGHGLGQADAPRSLIHSHDKPGLIGHQKPVDLEDQVGAHHIEPVAGHPTDHGTDKPTLPTKKLTPEPRPMPVPAIRNDDIEIPLPEEEKEVARTVVSGANQDMLVTRGMLGDAVGTGKTP